MSFCSYILIGVIKIQLKPPPDGKKLLEIGSAQVDQSYP